MTLVVVVASLLTVSLVGPANAARDTSRGATRSAVPRLPVVGTDGDSDGDVIGDATMYMRRLALTHDLLRGAARKQADATLARPRLADEKIICSASVPICVHYSGLPYNPKSGDAPDMNGTINPSVVLSNLEHIYSVYQSSGYRMPEPDHTTGGGTTQVNGLPVPADDVDIYLANIGRKGYYGYCAPEPLKGVMAHHTPAFCVLDNDYAEFLRGTPLTNLQVTAAHEFFHAVQFAYDATEDSWFMESTAVWMEDEVFDNINDNTQYLPYGPLGRPSVSLDKNTQFGVYGGWIFFRWVTEHRPQLTGQLPSIILSMWQRAAAGAHDRYSLQAVASALSAAGLPLRTTFARFAAANRDPAHNYSEGRANHYPVAPIDRSFRLSSTKRVSGSTKINHLAAATERFVPQGRKLRGKRTMLRLTLNMAPIARGSGAVVTIYPRGGAAKQRLVHLNRRGHGFVAVPFSSSRIRRVELTMSNASTRMTCWVGGLYACQGQPKDMRVPEGYSAQVHG
jgi:hypothetical protein